MLQAAKCLTVGTVQVGITEVGGGCCLGLPRAAEERESQVASELPNCAVRPGCLEGDLGVGGTEY